MAQDRIDSFYDLEELRRNREAALQIVREGTKAIIEEQEKVKGSTASPTAGGLGAGSKQVKELSDAIKSLVAIQKEEIEVAAKMRELAGANSAARAKEREEKKAIADDRKLEMANTKEVLALKKEVARQEAELRKLEIAGSKEALAIQKELAKQKELLVKAEIAQSKEAERQKAADRKLEIAGAKEALAIQKELDKQRKAQLAAQSKEAAEIAKAEKNVVDLTKAEQVLILKIKEKEAAYKQSYLTMGAQSAQTVKLKDETNALKDTQNKMNQAIGNYRSNVGNYSSAWNGLGNSINQVAREMPNFAQSMQLGMLAISNNIPILADEIKRAKDNIAALKAEGKSAPSLFSQIGASIFSWQTAMVLAITVGMKLVEMWEKGGKAAQESAKALEKYKSALNSAEETERSAAQQQIARMNILTSLAADNAQTTRTRTLAVEELQKTYPSTYGALEKQAILEGRLGDAVNKTTQALLDRAAAQAAEKKFAAASEKIYDLTLAQRDAQVKLMSEQKKLDELTTSASSKNASEGLRNRWVQQGSAVRSLQSDLKNLDKELKTASKEQAQFLKDAKDSAAKAGDILFNDRKTNEERRKPITKKEVDEAARLSKELADSILAQMNNIAESEQLNINKRLTDIRNELDGGLITIAEYQDKKKIIVKEGEDSILSLQIAALDSHLKDLGLDAEGRARIQEVITTKHKEEIKRRQAADEEASLQAAKQREDDLDFYDNLFKEAEKGEQDAAKARLKLEKDTAEKEKKIQEEKYRYTQQLVEETTQLIFTLLDAQSQRELSELDKKKDRLTEEYDLKNKAVENAAITEDERAARKAVLDAEELERQKQIDNEIKAIKRKQAIYDKAQAIATIGINTAVAISKLVAQTGGLGSPLIPLIIALGAAQAATVLATPIPEYAKGKKETDSYEGLAIAGEKGTEMRIDKDGNLQLLDKPTLIYTKRGDTILSNEQLKKGAAAKYVGEGASANYDELIRAYSYNTERTIKAIKSTPANVIIDNSPYYLNIKRARA